MAIVRWEPFGRSMSPFRGFDTLRRSMDRLMDDFSHGESSESGRPRWIPSVDLVEDNDKYFLNVEVPGMQKEDIKISLQDNVLSISGEKRIEREKKENAYHLVERSVGQFSRSFALPSLVDEAKIKANYKDGILSIDLPKAPEAKRKEISISVD